MTIDRLNPIDPMQNPPKTGSAGRIGKGDRGDSINLSSEAVEKSELFSAIEIAKNAPDVRADRIAELKSRINDPDYIDDTVISATADRIIDQFF
ncbi:MAG: flagellar biosynthesis anti-sigma factor FlgM [Spirochaetes bacterium]|nr:flagellar biosynthesis anti-sigma factor FlgM [Spirochaetota bacterium]